MAPKPNAEKSTEGREWRDLARASAPILLASAVVGTIIALSGGFGSGVLDIAPRLVYWIGLSATGAAIGITTARLALPRTWFVDRPMTAWAALVPCIAAPMTVIVAFSTAAINHQSFGPMLAEVFPSTLATTAGMTALAFLVRRRQPVETHAAAPGAPPAKFLARLPSRLSGAELWAIEAEDHYLRLHTSKGRDLILMRLSDAVAELEGVEGARTHRSWWVARVAVTAAERGDGRATLTLIDGSEIPVSRAYAKVLRTAGWF